MKARTLLKLFAHSLLLSLSVCGVALAQDSDSEWKPLKGFDYTAQTIDGQRINIDSLVRAGKKVVLDFSGTFCRPCWAIHQRGTAERLWKKYGPPGSDEVFFIWVEATGASKATIEGKEGDTLGDWTNGGTVPYPIVSDAHMADALGIPLSYVPCIVLLSAHGTYTEVQEILQISEEGVYNKSKECLSAQDAPVVRDLYAPSWGMTNKTPCEIQAYVGSVTPITKYIWKVNGQDYATTSEPRLILNWPTEGEIELALTAVNQHGASTPLSKQIKVRLGEEKTPLPISESFEKEGLIEIEGKYHLQSSYSYEEDDFSESEIECLSEAVEENKNISFGDLTNKSHDKAWHNSTWYIDYLEMAKAVTDDPNILKYIQINQSNENIRFVE